MLLIKYRSHFFLASALSGVTRINFVTALPTPKGPESPQDTETIIAQTTGPVPHTIDQQRDQDPKGIKEEMLGLWSYTITRQVSLQGLFQGLCRQPRAGETAGC